MRPDEENRLCFFGTAELDGLRKIPLQNFIQNNLFWDRNLGFVTLIVFGFKVVVRVGYKIMRKGLAVFVIFTKS